MNVYEIMSVAQVVAGSIIMFLSIALAVEIRDRVSHDLSRKWQLIILLMVFFFLGYLFFVYALMTKIRFPLELLTGGIFFGGACFVYIVVKLTERTIDRLQVEIRERQKLQEHIAFAKQEWEETFDIINDAITIHDADFNIIRANKAAQEMLGLPFAEIIGQKCFRLYHGTENPPDACPSCTALKSGIAVTQEVFEPHLNKFLEIKALPRAGEATDGIGIVHVIRDITRRKGMEEEKERLITDLEKALANVKTLKGLLPMCAWCKNIRDDKGYWKEVEDYIQTHSDATFTHGICPNCLKKEEDDYNTNNGT